MRRIIVRGLNADLSIAAAQEAAEQATSAASTAAAAAAAGVAAATSADRAAAQSARAGAEAARDDAEALVILDLGTSDGQMAAVASTSDSEFSTVLATSYAARVAGGGPAKTTGYASGPVAEQTIGGTGIHIEPVDTDTHIWNDWLGNNVLSIRNTADTTGSPNGSDAAIKFLATDGREKAAIGYHNGPGYGGSPFIGAAFWESSDFINFDSTSDLDNPPPPMRIVQTGVLGGILASYCRQEFTDDGDVVFYDFGVDFPSLSRMFSILPNEGRVDSAYPLTVGNALTGRTADSTAPLNVVHNEEGPSDPELMVNIVRAGYGKVQLVMRGGVGAQTLFFNDTDHAKTPLRISLDNKNNVGLVGGSDMCGGEGVIAFRNAAVNPTTNSIDGGVLYVDGGALKYRGAGGTVTTIGPA